MQRGTSSDNSGSRSVLLTVGCKTTQPSLCGFRIRSLAVWERTLSAKEVRSIYLAGTKGISKCLLRNVKKSFSDWFVTHGIRNKAISQSRL